MDSELSALSNALNTYKSSIEGVLEKINENVREAVNKNENTRPNDTLSKSKLSLEILAILRNHIKILHSTERLSRELSTKLTELEEGEKSTNPFRPSSQESDRSTPVFLAKDEEQSISDLSFCSISTIPSTESNIKSFISQSLEVSGQNAAASCVLPEDVFSLPRRDVERVEKKHDASVRKRSRLPVSIPLNTVDVKRSSIPKYEDLPKSPEDALKVVNISGRFKIEKVDDAVLSPPKVQTEKTEKSALQISIKQEAQETTPPREEINIKRIEVPTESQVVKIEIRDHKTPPSSPLSPKGAIKRSPRSPKSPKGKVTFKLNPEIVEIIEHSAEGYPEDIQGTAIQKLTRMPSFDWREDYMKKLEIKSLKKELKWSVIPTVHQNPPPQEIEKKAKPHFDISDGELSVGNRCIICHVESPSEFYVRTDQTVFESFENLLNQNLNDQHQYVVNKFKTKEDAKTNFGKFCLGFFTGRRKWYRLEILDWMDEESDSILVQLIDFGEKHFWSYTFLKSMSEMHSLLPKLAIRCHLAGIDSPILDHPTKWPLKSIDYFTEISEMKNMTEFLTIFAHLENDSYAVDLRKVQDPDADTLGEMLVATKNALQVEIEQNKTLETIDEEDDFEEYDNINELIAGYDAKDEARICIFTDENGVCFKGPSCRLDHQRLAPDGTTTDKVLTTCEAMIALVLPDAGQIVEILITGYVNTCHFYAQIIIERSENGPYNKKFEQLSQHMNGNNVVQNFEKFKIFPGIGELVLVKHESSWHRGRCIGLAENHEFEVFLVDFGFRIVTGLKNLRLMKDDFLYVPFQAVECIIYNCRERETASETFSRQFFYSAMNKQVFTALVIESTVPLRLQLWDSQTLDMTHVLIQSGLGQERDNDVDPIPNNIFSCN